MMRSSHPKLVTFSAAVSVLLLVTAATGGVRQVSASPVLEPDQQQQQSRSGISFQKLPLEVEPDSVHNVHITYNDDNPLDGELSLVFGPCDLNALPSSSSEANHHHHHHIGTTHIGAHPLAARHVDWDARRPSRFVWVTPSSLSARGDDEPSCLHAFLDGQHVGRSDEEVHVVHKKKANGGDMRRRSNGSTFADVADPMGPWFDGVAYLKQKQPNETFVAATKNKRFGILGAGMAGLTTGVSHYIKVQKTPEFTKTV